MRKTKIAVITLFTVVMLGIAGLLIYEFIDAGSISRDTIVRASLIVVAGIIALIKAFWCYVGAVIKADFELTRHERYVDNCTCALRCFNN